MAKTPPRLPGPPDRAEREPDPDLLAAVVLHTLVSRAGHNPGGDDHTGSATDRGHGLSVADIAIACERDPADAAERREVEAALELLRADELARRRGALWQATRAAVRAAELSF